MPIINQEMWKSWVDANKDPYGGTCIKIAAKVMEYLDEVDDDIDADGLITKANEFYNEGITGFMAGTVASMVSQCHSKGKEFRKSWNKSYGVDSEEGTVNPAILKFGGRKNG